MDVGISEKHISKHIIALRLVKMATFVENATDYIVIIGKYVTPETCAFIWGRRRLHVIRESICPQKMHSGFLSNF